MTNQREARVVIARARELLRQMSLDEQRAARPIVFKRREDALVQPRLRYGLRMIKRKFS